MNTDAQPGPSTTAHPQGIQIAQWLSWADEDYLAARALLLRAFVLQGTVLANTSIEKYIKAALVVRGASFRNTHDVTSLYELLKSSGPVAPVKASFLKALGKAYKLRYPDDLPAGFNISLAQVKILVETDSTVHLLRKGFTLQRTDGRAVTTKLDTLLADNDVTLTEKNAAFGSCARADVFACPTHCYELRVWTIAPFLRQSTRRAPSPMMGFLTQRV